MLFMIVKEVELLEFEMEIVLEELLEEGEKINSDRRILKLLFCKYFFLVLCKVICKKFMSFKGGKVLILY